MNLIDIKALHVKRFGIEPKEIGMHWDDVELLIKEIQKSIDNNVPYNEMDKLSEEEKEAYSSDQLFF